jgi:hypothetical protein
LWVRPRALFDTLEFERPSRDVMLKPSFLKWSPCRWRCCSLLIRLNHFCDARVDGLIIKLTDSSSPEFFKHPEEDKVQSLK